MPIARYCPQGLLAVVFLIPLGVFAVAPTLLPAPRKAVYGTGDFAGDPQALARAVGAIVRDASLPAEGYAISVTRDAIAVRAADDAGAFYAEQTLRQLVTTNCYGATAPVIEIVDSPAYPWRSIMLDEGRHFFGKETVKDLIARMAEHKLNTLHWHLTEDQGWRIDIPGHPELVRSGAVRSASVRFRTSPYWPDGDYAPFRFDENGEKYGPYYYTVEDVQEILAFAKAHHVKVMPELELPGHVRALLAAHPEFSCIGEKLPRTPRVWWGVEPDVICAGNEEAMKFLEELLDRFCDLFPDADIIHIGGDECPKDRWASCPKCQARIRAEGLKDVHALQSYVTMRMTKHLRKRGRRTMGWDAVLIGGALDAEIQVNWRKARKRSTVKTAAAAAELGHNVVLIEDSYAYFDYEQGLADDPAYYIPGRGPITVEDVYALEPVKGIPAAAQSKILGAEGCLWSEYIWHRADLDWATWPRACALAEALWTGEDRPGFEDFASRLTRHRRRLLADGVNCAPISRRARTMVVNPSCAVSDPLKPIAFLSATEARRARNPVLGDVCSVVAPTDLATCPAAFLSGADGVSVATLESYVQAGGTLFASAADIARGTLSSALAGVTFGMARLVGGQDLLDERGACVAALDGESGLLLALGLCGAKPFLRDEQGNVAAYAHDVGKGRVVTVAYDGMPEQVLDYLLCRTQAEMIPFAVEGNVRWGLGRTPSGWRMWFQGGPSSTEVVVRASALRQMTVRDVETSEMFSTPAGLFKLTVATGRLRVVTIEPKRVQ